MAGEVNLEIVDHLATVTLNQPTKLNAVSVEMYRQFGEIFTHLSEGETIGAIVLRGAGEKAIRAGADIGDFDDSRSGSEQAKEYAALDNSVMSKLRFCPHPTIAKIRGVCVGGGLYIANSTSPACATSASPRATQPSASR